MKSTLRNLAAIFVVVFLSTIFAAGQNVNPAHDIRWPSSCTTSGSVYSPNGNSCVTTVSGGGGTPTLIASWTNSGAALTANTVCGLAVSGGTLTQFTLMGDGTTGGATVDVSTETYLQWLAGTAPTSITGGNPLSFSSAKGVQTNAFTGWTTTTIVAGNVYCFALTSPSSIVGLTATLTY